MQHALLRRVAQPPKSNHRPPKSSLINPAATEPHRRRVGSALPRPTWKRRARGGRGCTAGSHEPGPRQLLRCLPCGAAHWHAQGTGTAYARGRARGLPDLGSRAGAGRLRATPIRHIMWRAGPDREWRLMISVLPRPWLASGMLPGTATDSI
jgi:hypothetical protein